jgi:adenosylcobinamide-phosphate synthase
MTSNQRLAVVLLALGIDLAFGDPPNRFHPVSWMGSLIEFARRHCPNNYPSAELAYGAVIVSTGSLCSAALGYFVQRLLDKLPTSFRIIGTAALFKTSFSVNGLDRAAREIQVALEASDLNAARHLLGRNLVSRDTSELNETQVASAAIESVAENASDSLIAPLFYYILGGLPLTLIYRFANTTDAMLGYHTSQLEWLGKAPARFDDLLNLLPARITAGLIILAAPWIGGNPRHTTQTILREASFTASPNAGYPMSAMAGALDVQLEKSGYYQLGASGRKPVSTDILRARRILFAVTGIATGLFSLLQYSRMKAERELVASASQDHTLLLAGCQEAGN